MLSLKINGYRCFETEKEFSFQFPGMSLLDAPNGSGKSTILDSILFTLFGTGKDGVPVGNITTNGKKSCTVKLDFSNDTTDLCIIRKNGKDKVSIENRNTGEIYEGSVAQEEINKFFGNNFSLTSYLSSNSERSFFSLSSAEKLGFLERLAIGDNNISQYKKLTGEIRSVKNKELIEKSARTEIIKSEFLSMKKPEDMKFPLGGKWSEKKVKNEEIRRKNNSVLLKKERKTLNNLYYRLEEARKDREEIEKLRHRLETNIKNIEEKENELQECVKKLNSIFSLNGDGNGNGKELKKPDASSIRKELSLLKDSLEYSKLLCLYNEEESRINNLIENERRQLLNELEELRESRNPKSLQTLSDEMKLYRDNLIKKQKIDEYLGNKKTLESSLEEYDSLEEYKRELEEVEAKIEEQKKTMYKLEQGIEQRKILHKCPNCKIYLRLNGEKGLEVFDDDILHSDQDDDTYTTDNIKEIRKGLKLLLSERDQYKEFISDIITISSKIEDLNSKLRTFQDSNTFSYNVDYNSLYSTAEKEYREEKTRLDKISNLEDIIEHSKWSKTIKELLTQLGKKKSNLEKYKRGNIEDSIEIEDLEEKISILTDQLEKEVKSEIEYKSLTSQISSIEKSLCKLRENTEEIKKSLSLLENTDSKGDIDLIESDIKKSKLTIEEYETLQVKYDDIHTQMQKFLTRQEEIEKYNNWNKKYISLTQEEEICRLELEALDILRKKIEESESIVISNIIDTINFHLKFYLDKFFIDPILVELRPFKEKADGEQKPGIDMYIQYKGWDQKLNKLSSGEQARVKIALILSLNTISGGKIILIDEALSNIDEEAKEVINEILKEECSINNKLIIQVLHGAVEGQFDYLVSL